jgi:hypothetical protein
MKPNSTPTNERTCYACGILEDEFHFILECNVYAELRQRLIPSYYLRHPNMQKLLELLNTDKENLTVILRILYLVIFRLGGKLYIVRKQT